jgi:hypothetical protein
MMDEAVKVGQQVRLPDSYQSGRVVEVDSEYHAVRVEVNEGGEKWVRLDEIEVVDPWDTQRRTAL